MSLNLSLVLLINGRPDFTDRWIKYAQQYGNLFELLIYDGADPEFCYLNNNKFKNKFLRYEYHRCEPDITELIFFEKVKRALSNVRTKYVLLASNDDFYNFSEITKDINFLNNNPSYSASRGEVWDYSIEGSTSLYGNFFLGKKLYKHPTVSGIGPLERVLDYTQKSNSVWHDVVRVDILLKAYEGLLQCQIRDLSLSELFISAYIAVNGSLARGDHIYMLHQVHDDMVAIKKLHQSPIDWINTPNWKKDFTALVNEISRCIIEADPTCVKNIDIQISEHIYKNIINKKIKSYLSEKRLSQNIKQIIKYYLKNSTKIKLAYRYLKDLEKKSASLNKDLFVAGVKEYIEEHHG